MESFTIPGVGGIIEKSFNVIDYILVEFHYVYRSIPRLSFLYSKQFR
jgi:hypothetical protein